MNHNDYVSVNHIIAEVSHSVGDSDFRNGCSKGWYVSRVQDALQELAFDTFYQILTADFEFPSDKLAMDLPKNCFNIREVYLWNGSCCSPQSSVVVWWKRLANNRGKGEGYTAKIKKPSETSGTDPFLPNSYDTDYTIGNGPLYWYNIQDGLMMFSSTCSAWSNVRIVYNGMGGEIGDEPLVPRFFERAINDYVTERFYNYMKSQDVRKYRPLWQDAKQVLDSYTGNWYKSKRRISTMDRAQKEALNEYISGIYHK